MEETTNPIRDYAQLLERSRAARLEFCVFRQDADVPGEVAAVSRLLWKHLPELARQGGVPIREDEGHPGGASIPANVLMKIVAEDVIASRPVASWLVSHLSEDAAMMFTRGPANALQPLLDLHAKSQNITRRDVLHVESHGQLPAQTSQEISR